MYYLSVILVATLILIQFVPFKQTYNPSAGLKENILLPNANEEVISILKTSCFDCHSNQTVYRWSSHVAPASWLIARDVSKGREALNFSDWNTYTKRKLVRKLADIKEQIAKKEMPLRIYTIMHPNTKLNQAQSLLITDWSDRETKKIMGQ